MTNPATRRDFFVARLIPATVSAHFSPLLKSGHGVGTGFSPTRPSTILLRAIGVRLPPSDDAGDVGVRAVARRPGVRPVLAVSAERW